MILTDAMALLYRSHFAFGDAHRLRTRGGEDTTVLFGFLNTLLNLLELTPAPTHFAVVFDATGKNFRHELYRWAGAGAGWHALLAGATQGGGVLACWWCGKGRHGLPGSMGVVALAGTCTRAGLPPHRAARWHTPAVPTCHCGQVAHACDTDLSLLPGGTHLRYRLATAARWHTPAVLTCHCCRGCI